VQIDVDGSVIPQGSVISAEDVGAPAPVAGSPSASARPGER
jgi:hypothetical protein